MFPVSVLASASAPVELFIRDWGLTLALGGGVCALVGAFIGWIIWKNTSKLAERVETANRTALADFERTSDEVSKIKSELALGSE